MPALNHRLPGILGAALSDNRLMVEIIADGIHVHPAVIKMLLRCKGVQRVIAISDSIAAAGMPDGKYEFEGLDVTVANGSARLNDGTLAGSISTLEKGLINLVHFGGISWQMHSVLPAIIRPSSLVYPIEKATSSLEWMLTLFAWIKILFCSGPWPEVISSRQINFQSS